MHERVKAAAPLAGSINQAVLAISPVRLPAPGRGQDLVVRVSALATGRDLPVILFSHGNGSSADGYGPLVQGWAAQGFVVLQPTHLDWRTLGLAPTDPRRPLLWRHRAEDLTCLLDQLNQLEAAVPLLQGRLDPQRLAVAGHSWETQTAGMLLGAQLPDPMSRETVNLADSAHQGAGAAGRPLPGRGRFTAYHGRTTSFPATRLRAHDDAHFSGRGRPGRIIHDYRGWGWDWRADAYALSAGPKCLLTLFGAPHSLGGIPGYESRETTDEHPARVTLVQRLTGAYLRSALYPADPAWPHACTAMRTETTPLG